MRGIGVRAAITQQMPADPRFRPPGAIIECGHNNIADKVFSNNALHASLLEQQNTESPSSGYNTPQRRFAVLVATFPTEQRNLDRMLKALRYSWAVLNKP